MEAVVGLGLFVAICAGIAWLAWAQKAKTRSQLHELATLFEAGAEVDESASSIAGEVDGLDVVFRFTTRGSGSSSESWTDVDVTHSVDELDLALRPHGWAENRAIAAGRAIDLQTGHVAFDERFVVEGAPSDLVYAALDEPICDQLVGLDGVADLKTPTAGQLRLSRRGWMTDSERASRTLQVAVALATRIRAAHTELSQSDRESSAYRDAPPQSSSRKERRRADKQALEAVREKRAARKKLIGWLFVGFVLVFMFAAMVASESGR